MHWNNVPKFDYALKRFDGYWDIADVDAFVDSELGNDSTGSGTATAPYKTISKVKSIGATKWAAGKVIMVNGVFDEILSIDAAVRIVGAGGGIGGRALFLGNINHASSIAVVLDNLYVVKNQSNFWVVSVGTNSSYMSNCVFDGTQSQGVGDGAYHQHYSYYCVYKAHTNNSVGNSYTYLRVMGNNNTFYNCVRTGGVSYAWQVYGNNNHFNNSIIPAGYNVGFKNILNTDGAYLDATNNNFNFLSTSPLYRTGTFNGTAGNYNNVGAGTLGINKVVTDDPLKPSGSGGSASYTNLEVYSTTKIKRTSVSSDGTLESGYVDLGESRNNVSVGGSWTYEYENGKMLRTIQQTTTHTYRNAFDFYLKYGDTTEEVDACDWLLMEWGKEITVTDVAGTLYGNADANFDPDDYFSPSFRYFKIKCVFKTRTA